MHGSFSISKLVKSLLFGFVRFSVDGSEGGGGAAAPAAAAPSAADMQAQIDAAVAQAVTGLKNKNTELLGKLKSFDGIDPDATRALLKRFENDEEAKLIAEGKIDVVLEKRTERMRADAEKRVVEESAKAQAALERAGKFSQKVLDNHIRAAAAKAGIHSHAIEDALFRGRTMFSLNDDGEAVQLGSDGSPVFGKDGKTALSPVEWLEAMKETAPHWFPNQNGGAGSSLDRNGAGGSAKQMKRAAFDGLNANDKSVFIRGGGKVVD